MSDLKILGEEIDVLNYNINFAHTTENKIIITGSKLFESLGLNILDFVDYLSFENLNFENTFVCDEFRKSLNFELSSNSNSVLENFENKGFAQILNNKLYTICLNFDFGVIEEFFVEKTKVEYYTLFLLKKYIDFLKKIKFLNLKFQIEIFESFDILKHITLKKNCGKLFLFASFGYPKQDILSRSKGGEIYIMQKNNFYFFKNEQKKVVVKNSNQLKTFEMNDFDNILSKEDLEKINDETKHISDALIRLNIASDNSLKVNHISLLEEEIESLTEFGAYIYKPKKDYENICLIGLEDVFESFNKAKFLLIESEDEVSNLLSDFKIFENLSGIIFTFPYHLQIFEKIAEQFCLYVFYSKLPLKKSENVCFNSTNLEIILNLKSDFQEEKVFVKNEDLPENLFVQSKNTDENFEIQNESYNSPLSFIKNKALETLENLKKDNCEDFLERDLEDNFVQKNIPTILTLPQIVSGNYFSENFNFLSELSNVEPKKCFVVSNSKNFFAGVNIITPVGFDLDFETHKLINSCEDFFLVEKSSKIPFLNLSYLNLQIKKEILKFVKEKFGKINIIALSSDLELLVENSDFIENIFIKDLKNYEEYVRISERFSGFKSLI